MTYVKKINPDWNPQEFPGIVVGDIVDFNAPVQRLVEEGNVVLCEKDGTEISAFEIFGKVTDKEFEEFKAWVEVRKQERLKQSLEKEHDSLVAEATRLKEMTTTEVPEKVEDDATIEAKKKKKEEFLRKMAEGRARAKAKKEAQKNA